MARANLNKSEKVLTSTTNVNIVKQDLLNKKSLKGGISIDADSGPPRYVL